METWLIQIERLWCRIASTAVGWGINCCGSRSFWQMGHSATRSWMMWMGIGQRWQRARYVRFAPWWRERWPWTLLNISGRERYGDCGTIGIDVSKDIEGVIGYFLDSQSATVFSLPGICFTSKLKCCKRTRQRTTIGTSLDSIQTRLRLSFSNVNSLPRR